MMHNISNIMLNIILGYLLGLWWYDLKKFSNNWDLTAKNKIGKIVINWTTLSILITKTI